MEAEIIVEIPKGSRNEYEIGHFFDVYKQLEPGKRTETGGWEGVTAAEAAITDAQARFGKPRGCDLQRDRARRHAAREGVSGPVPHDEPVAVVAGEGGPGAGPGRHDAGHG